MNPIQGFKKGREYMLCTHDVSQSYGNSRNVAESRIGTQTVDQAKVMISYVDMQSVVLELRTEGEIVPRFINELLSSHDRKGGFFIFSVKKKIRRKILEKNESRALSLSRYKRIAKCRKRNDGAER